MGRSRHKYNKSSDEGLALKRKHVELDGNMGSTQGFDESNPLVIASGDKVRRRKANAASLPKKLTKKERKKLEKVLELKRKKEQRAQLLHDLGTVQIDKSELAMMNSVAHLGTRNSKLTDLSKRPLPHDMKEAVKKASEESDFISHYNFSAKGKRRKMKKKRVEKVSQESSPVLTECSSGEEDTVVNEEQDETSEQPPDCETGERGGKLCDDEESVTSGDEMESQPSAVEESMLPDTTPDDKEASSALSTPTELPASAEVTAPSDTAEKTPATYVHVDRSAEMQEARLALPILAEEHNIMDAIRHHPVVVICGETGSGKTTQVPQFLYEAGFANEGVIGITQPRRVAAVSMSHRVAAEMNLPSTHVSYHIRYRNNVTARTRIKMMTDGVLAREIRSDFLLAAYSAIVLDEAHERTANTDLLVGLLSRIVLLRAKKGKPLKLVVMSATLRVEDFTKNERLFKSPPPVLKIDVRQHPVTVHFNKRTPGCHGDDDDGDIDRHAYLAEAYSKICKIHRTLPPGGVLVFVTGRQEVHALQRKLQATFPSHLRKPCAENEKSETNSASGAGGDFNLDSYKSLPTEDANDDDDDVKNAEARMSSDEESDDEIAMDDSAYSSDVDSSLPLHVLPLYSMLPPNKQKLVFQPPPAGCRLCVVATNVAETSLTIPDIKYVVDTGKVKRRVYDAVTGVSSFRVTWTSKASANQRAGRAGRVSAGHAYRLYSSAVFQDFDDFDRPEVTSRPVPGLVLQMKSMSIDRVHNFPFPTSPPQEALDAAESLLESLGAIERPSAEGKSFAEMKKARSSGRITQLGHVISSFPVHPRYGKMVAVARQQRGECDVLAYVVAVVAALTVGELFIAPASLEGNDPETKEKRRHMAARLLHLKSLWCGGESGSERRSLADVMVLLSAVGSAAFAGSGAAFCVSNCLRPKAMVETQKLRRQLTNTANCVLDNCDLCLDPHMAPPSNKQIRLLRQVLLSALGDHVARKSTNHGASSSAEERRKMKGAYDCLVLEEAVYLHPDSIVSTYEPAPEFVVFQQLSSTEGGKTYMREVVVIEREWLARWCPQHCNSSKPLATPAPAFDRARGHVTCHVTATYGRRSWPIGDCEVVFPPSVERYRWFARFLLEGEVMTSLKKYVPCLLSRPATMIKTWANLQPRTETLLRALVSRQIDSRPRLLDVWSTDPTYLRSALLDWLPSAAHSAFLASWPPR